MKTELRLTVAAFVTAAFHLSAATIYVSLESTILWFRMRLGQLLPPTFRMPWMSPERGIRYW